MDCWVIPYPTCTRASCPLLPLFIHTEGRSQSIYRHWSDESLLVRGKKGGKGPETQVGQVTSFSSPGQPQVLEDPGKSSHRHNPKAPVLSQPLPGQRRGSLQGSGARAARLGSRGCPHLILPFPCGPLKTASFLGKRKPRPAS